MPFVVSLRIVKNEWQSQKGNVNVTEYTQETNYGLFRDKFIHNLIFHNFGSILEGMQVKYYLKLHFSIFMAMALHGIHFIWRK